MIVQQLRNNLGQKYTDKGSRTARAASPSPRLLTKRTIQGLSTDRSHNIPSTHRDNLRISVLEPIGADSSGRVSSILTPLGTSRMNSRRMSSRPTSKAPEIDKTAKRDAIIFDIDHIDKRKAVNTQDLSMSKSSLKYNNPDDKLALFNVPQYLTLGNIKIKTEHGEKSNPPQNNIQTACSKN